MAELPVYENSVAKVERIVRGNKVVYGVWIKADNRYSFEYQSKKLAIKYAKHCETWRPMTEPYEK